MNTLRDTGAIRILTVDDHLLVRKGTVKSHMKSILPKLDASDRTHAVMIALKRGILDV